MMAVIETKFIILAGWMASNTGTDVINLQDAYVGGDPVHHAMA